MVTGHVAVVSFSLFSLFYCGVDLELHLLPCDSSVFVFASFHFEIYAATVDDEIAESRRVLFSAAKTSNDSSHYFFPPRKYPAIKSFALCDIVVSNSALAISR